MCGPVRQLAVGLTVAAVIPVPAAGKEPSRAELVERRQAALRKLSDAELMARYDTAAISRWSEEKDELTREEVLVEAIRRGGPAIEKLLRTKMETDYERRLKEKETLAVLKAQHEARPKDQALKDRYWEQERVVRRLEDNLAIFTALRRVQNKADPLTVEVAIPKDVLATTRKLPIFDVRITNTDPEQLPLWFQFGGDTRPGRPARWRFEVADEKGQQLPVFNWRAAFGGGLTRFGFISGRESWETKLRMADFIRIRDPGEYTVRVLYHNDSTIAEFEDLSGLVLFESKPFKLKVVKAPRLVIKLERGDRDKARKAIAGLSEDEPVRVAIDKYGPNYHDFIDPKSPAGQLHELGWRAVPALLDCLRDDKTSPRRRAWVVGLLYGITREREMNPFGLEADWDNVLSGYEYRGAWGSGSTSGGKIDVPMQKKLAAQWLKLADEYFEVREAK